jgi:hypothetical protein
MVFVGLVVIAVLLGTIAVALYVAKNSAAISTSWAPFKKVFVGIWKVLFFAAVGIAIYFLLYPNLAKESPSVASVITELQSRWLLILIIAGASSIVLARFMAHSGTYQKVLWGVVGVVLVFGKVLVWATTPKEERGWSALVLPPEGRSVDMKVPRYHHIEVDGTGFQIVTVYKDGNECSENCPDGQISHTFLKNALGEDNRISFAFVRSK